MTTSMPAPVAMVAGLGPAGLAAALALATLGVAVAAVGRAAETAEDPRTVALMQPSLRLLARLGVWPEPLGRVAAPLERLRIVDETGSLLAAPETVFDAAELGEEAFGWNIPLADLIAALAGRARDLGIDIIEDEVMEAVVTRTEVRLGTRSGRRLAASVAVAADGRASRLRAAAGIALEERQYPQGALATAFSHSAPHLATSSEYHKPGGPLTTVPLPGDRSGLVWMDAPMRIATLAGMDEVRFCRELQAAIHGDLGRVTACGPRRAFPMAVMTARRAAHRRVLLVGEAGHVFPPIGAQGLNLSLRDAAAAAELITEAAGRGADPGGDAVTAAYEARRRMDAAPRIRLIEAVNRSLLSGGGLLDEARALGLALVAGVPALRRGAMRLGLAESAALPRLMR
jgi:2-octaprenyl-6-methoxyphenol hydroxylase